jgi:hypothetical protein
MNRIVNQSNDHIWIAYIFLMVTSTVTFKKIKLVEDNRTKLKVRLKEERNRYKI